MLHVTADMIRDLYETEEANTDTRDEAALILTPDGWEVSLVHYGGTGVTRALTALTGREVFDAADTDPYADPDTEPGTPDDALIEALAASLDGRHYRIPRACGSTEPPAPGTAWCVVTGRYTGDSPTPGPYERADITRDWETAVWIERDAVREAVAEPYTDRLTLSTSLWTTPEGTGYLLRLHSLAGGEYEYEWVWISAEDALIYTYRADDADIEDACADDPLLGAARAARAMTDALAVPEDAELAPAVRAFSVTRILSDWLRTQGLTVLAQERGAAGQAVVDAFGGDRQAAADHLGISYKRFSNIISARST
ncbi:hypothetical protein [Streptomyces sp. NPDC087294]|uniref:hypothetical protein n=1 Tax=Streptomyces sp. NPDC087294 TaxID=3365777 RepID=UPI00380A27FF